MIPETSATQALQTIRQTLASRETATLAATPHAAAAGTRFGDALDYLMETQAESDRAIEKLIAGQQDDLHQVMLSAEKTDLTFRVALQLRNKLVQAYQEVMRMQV